MTVSLHQSATVLFQGDSITDVGRLVEHDCPLGNGYVRMIADRVRSARPESGITIINRGIGGDGIADLRARWREDAIDLAPDVVSVLIGINDTWRRYDSGVVTSVDAYENHYRALLAQLRDELDAQLLLVEPFLVPVRAEQWAWREDLDPRIHVVRRLAEEFGAALLAADGLLNQAAREAGGAKFIAGDGVHPTPLGHTILAEAWAGLAGLPGPDPEAERPAFQGMSPGGGTGAEGASLR
ncbi:SGNH/GDSL hydrolase family protein [Streptomyces sp. NPDC048301]|uniref:SGNH/GDSL hydrolase family protein n=1 Tax=unclassified Streptomyces TaxID=2593676 RepID=UPI0034392AC8